MEKRSNIGKVISLTYFLIIDFLIIFGFISNYILGFKIMPTVVFDLYRFDNDAIPLITKIAMNGFVSRGLPIIFLISAFVLHLKIPQIKPHSKIGLFLLTILSISLFIMLFIGIKKSMAVR